MSCEGVFHTPCLAQTMFLLLIPSLFLLCRSVQHQYWNDQCDFSLETDLTPGFTTFKLKYRQHLPPWDFITVLLRLSSLPATDGTHAAGTFNLDATSAISLAMAGAGLNRPTYDATGSGYGTATSVTTGSVTHTGVSGATPILAAGIGCSTTIAFLVPLYGGGYD